MNIKNKEIITIYKGISTIKSKHLPVRVGFAINKNLSALNGVAQIYEEERRKILDKYCEKDENGQLLTKNNEFVISDKEMYASEINDLLNIENDVDIHTISISDLEKCDEDRYDVLTPNELESLTFMISED